jgi:hypothetical protein
MKVGMKNNPASALMVVVIGTAGLMILLFTCWQIGSWYDEIMVERMRVVKRFYATEQGLNAGLVLVARQFDALRTTLTGRMAPVALSVPAVQIDGHLVACRVTVGLPPEQIPGMHLVVQAELIDAGRPVSCLACFVEKIVTTVKKEASFVVHHFTTHVSS